MAELNDYKNDTLRRVAANCTRPRSATEIAMVLRGSGAVPDDPNVENVASADGKKMLSVYTAEGIQVYLDQLEADGLVKNLGPFSEAEHALDSQNADGDVVDFQGNPEVFVNSAASPLGWPHLELGEDHYVMTKLALEKLVGEVPGAPGTGAMELSVGDEGVDDE